MAAITNITINDGEPTPVAHVFEPAKTTADYAFWEDRDAGIYLGNKKLTMTLQRPSGSGNVGNRNLKGSLKIEVPVLEVLGNSAAGIPPPPTLAYRLVAEILYTFPERSTQQQRKNMRTFIGGLMSNAQVVDFFDKLSIPY